MMDIETLKHIAALGAMQKAVKIVSSQLAELMLTSPQTAARRLQILEKEGLIERQTTTNGQWIKLTPSGIKRLEEEYRFYKQLFNVKSTIELVGTVLTGLGEGQYYLSSEGYKKQIEQKLGFTPYPGTLNIKLDSESVRLRGNLDAKAGIKINGFTSEKRTFGGGICFPVTIKDVKCAIIQPERTHYSPEILEIIAPVNLRKHLNLHDSSIVKINID